MLALISTWLLVMTSSIVVLGASLGGSPLSALGQGLADKGFGLLLKRHTRSFDPSDLPCDGVSIDRLIELQDKFRSIVDHNADGKATPSEVKSFFQSFKDVSDDVVKDFIARRDVNKNGVLDFVPDYVQSLTSGENSLEEAKEWFFLHDTNDDGFITDNEIAHVARNLGVPPEHFQGYYMAFDNNRDGKLNFDEFKLLHA